MTTRFSKKQFENVFDSIPTTIILTKTGNFSLNHPSMLDAPGPVRIMCSDDDSSLKLSKALFLHRNIHVCRMPSHPSISMIVSKLLENGEKISIEAGPSTTNPLYDSGQIDAVLLSWFHGNIDETCIGTETMSTDRLHEDFTKIWNFQSDDKLWRFSLHLKKSLIPTILSQQADLSL